jgi:hypothetical protein
MDRPFGPGRCGDPDLHQPASAGVERTRTVAFFSELLKSPPDVPVFLLKSLRPLGELCFHANSPLSHYTARNRATSLTPSAKSISSRNAPEFQLSDFPAEESTVPKLISRHPPLLVQFAGGKTLAQLHG